MCGIAGVISADRRQVEPAVRLMMRAMVHRGPDDEGYEELDLGGGYDAPVAGFGFRRLSILDLSPAGHQPMFNRATGDCLIFNGEIYNFRSLKAKLKAEGVEVSSSGDTEVLLKSLSQWGDAVLAELDGMFAFAFYEAKSRRVLLARDSFGIKPLYVSQLSRGIVFASEVRAVLASGLVPDDLDPAGIASYLAYGSPQEPLTVHSAIKSFPAGSAIWVGRSIAEGRPLSQPRRYWQFPDAVAAFSEEEAVGRVAHDLQQSVRDQCESDVPLGVFLSGGIDSGTIAALARHRSGDVHTFAVGFRGHGEFDETGHAAATAMALGTVHRQTILDDPWVAARWRDWMLAADRPSIDGFNTFVVSGVVKDQGMTVALSGLGADELFGGYGHFRSIPRVQRWLSRVGWVPSGLRRWAAGTALRKARRSKREKAMDLVSGRANVLDILLGIRRSLSDREIRQLGFSPAAVGLSSTFLPPAAYERFRDTKGDAFRMISQAECFLYMANTLLRDSDTYSMAHSLELRVPFLGKSVSELAASLPGSMQAPPGSEPKHLLREAVKDLLPAEVFTRPKTGFSLPMGDWMFGSLLEESSAAVESLAACPLVDGDGVRRLWQEYGSNVTAVHWSRPLTLVALGNYLQRLSA